MSILKAFKGWRPTPGLAEEVSCLPYDVMNTQEAREMAEGKPHSFLHVIRSEIDLPSEVGPYEEAVYQRAAENLAGFLEQGVFIEESSPCFYIYQQVWRGRVQTGLVAAASIDAYMDGRIKKHEHTRHEKEIDRIKHFTACRAHTEPVFLTYRSAAPLESLIRQVVQNTQPVYDFTTGDAVTHRLWPVDAPDRVAEIQTALDDVSCFYIADGHHRSASSARVGLAQREKHPDYTGEEAFNRFLVVAFPDSEMEIMDYNRVVADLNGLTPGEFFERLDRHFDLEPWPGPFYPDAKYTFGMYLDNQWYRLTFKRSARSNVGCAGALGNAAATSTAALIGDLDVSILQDYLLGPILGIEDPRTDHRIDFVGGIRGLKELEKRCSEAGDMRLAFAMYPTKMSELLAIADAGQVMPPKSTWFEPKLRSGLFVHPF